MSSSRGHFAPKVKISFPAPPLPLGVRGLGGEGPKDDGISSLLNCPEPTKWATEVPCALVSFGRVCNSPIMEIGLGVITLIHDWVRRVVLERENLCRPYGAPDTFWGS